METTATRLSTEQIIVAVNELSLPELDRLFDTILKVRAARFAPTPSSIEEPLLKRANQGPPAEFQARFNALKAKREGETITDAEYEELTQLALDAEVLHAERMGALAELAKLRGMRLPALMEQLGIHFPEDA